MLNLFDFHCAVAVMSVVIKRVDPAPYLTPEINQPSNAVSVGAVSALGASKVTDSPYFFVTRFGTVPPPPLAA